MTDNIISKDLTLKEIIRKSEEEKKRNEAIILMAEIYHKKLPINF